MTKFTPEHRRLQQMFEPLELRSFENDAMFAIVPTSTGIQIVISMVALDEGHIVRANIGFDATSKEASELSILMTKCIASSIRRQHERACQDS